MKAKILLIDDATSNIELLFDILNNQYEIFFATNGIKGLELAQLKQPDLILLDIIMPDLDGFAVCSQLKQNPLTRNIPIIFLTAETEIETIIQGFAAGIVDYVTKPFNAAELLARVNTQTDLQLQRRQLQQKNEELEQLNSQLQNEIRHRQQIEAALENADQKLTAISDQEARRWKIEAFVGISANFLNIVEQIRKLQQVDRTNVLILGESGTGKELVARSIHYGSERKSEPFITVNCSAIPHELADSAFFGHVKGAFTGAHDNRAGYFEAADQGTLFLDELGDLPLHLQTKLLRVLEDRKVMRVGSTRERPVNVRIISATNSHLEQRIIDNSFRQDLYYRLTGYTIHLPALRERIEDIPLLTRHFLNLLSAEMNRSGAQISQQALHKLQHYHFPGNIRELRNIIEHALISSGGQTLQAAHLHLIESPTPARTATTAETSIIPEQPLPAMFQNAYQSDTVIQYLNKHQQINNLQCQQLLGLNHHQASYLLKKMHKQGQLILNGERRWAFYTLNTEIS